MGLAWNMWEGGTHPIDLNPHTGGWPGLSIYLTLGIQLLCRGWYAVGHPGAGAVDFARYAEAHWDSLFLAARWVGVLVGVTTVGLTFGLGSAVLGAQAGIAAALLLALNPLHIITSQHVSDPNLLALLFVLLAARAMVRVVEGGDIRDSTLAGAAIGLATAAKYAPIVLLPVLAFAHAGSEGRVSARIAGAFRSRALWIGIAAAGVAFLVASPFTLLDWSTTVRDLSVQRERLFSGWVGENALPISLPAYLARALPRALGWPAHLMSIVGLAVLWRSGRVTMLVASIPILLVLANGLLRTAQERYVLPAMPVLLIAAAAVLARAGTWIVKRVPAPVARSWTAPLLLTAAAVWPLPAYVATRASLAMPDSRHEARAWVNANLDPSEAMAVEVYGPSFNTLRPGERRTVTWPFYATLAGLVRPAYDVSFLDGLRYIVLSSEVSRRFESDPRSYPVEVAYYARIRERTRPVWVSDSTRFSGPRIEVRSLPAAFSTRSERDSVFARLLPRPNGSDRLALWCQQMADLFAEQGDYGRVEEWASRGLRVGAASMDGDLFASLAYAQLALERPLDAERTARAGITSAPNNLALRICLGAALRALGRNEEALTAFQKANALAPGQEVSIYMAETLAALGRRAEASTMYRRAADAEPDPARAQSLRDEAARLDAGRGRTTTP